MRHAPVNFPIRLAILCLFALTAVVAGDAFAGQLRGGAGIPPRIKKIKKGDWVLYREDDGFRKETAADNEEIEKDFLIHYTIEEFDEKGKSKGAPQEVVRFETDEQTENAEFIQSVKGAKVERRKVKIDGKNVEVVVYIVVDKEDNSTTEYWYSDDLSIDGKVAMIVTFPDNEQHKYSAFEVVGFGDARAKFDIKKYLD